MGGTITFPSLKIDYMIEHILEQVQKLKHYTNKMYSVKKIIDYFGKITPKLLYPVYTHQNRHILTSCNKTLLYIYATTSLTS
jgi:hypothetical protein